MAHAWLMVTPKSLAPVPKRPDGVLRAFSLLMRSTPPKALGSCC